MGRRGRSWFRLQPTTVDGAGLKFRTGDQVSRSGSHGRRLMLGCRRPLMRQKSRRGKGNLYSMTNSLELGNG